MSTTPRSAAGTPAGAGASGGTASSSAQTPPSPPPPPPRTPVPTPPPPRPTRAQQAQQRRPGRLPRLRPETGFFAPVEPIPAADLPSPLAAVVARDPTVKGGRWDPEFVWNTDWERAMEASDAADAPKAAAASAALAAAAEGRTVGSEGGGATAAADPAGPALSRRAALDDPTVDLTAALLAPRAPLVPGAVPVGRGGGRAGEGAGAAGPRRPPADVAARRWGPDGRFAAPAPAPSQPGKAPWAGREEAAAAAAAAAAEAAEYEGMKAGLMAWTVGAGAAGTAAAAAFYSRETALAYALGAVGGALYLRLLNKSVDGLGGGGGLGAAAGPPRLLIPVILAAGANRYNTLVAPTSGISLPLLPMLVGFFTYKAAVVGRQGLALLGDLARDAGANKK